MPPTRTAHTVARRKPILLKRAGKTVKLVPRFRKDPGMDRLELKLMTLNGKRAGWFIAQKLVGERAWNIYHRLIKEGTTTRNSFRGHGLGKTGLRMMEEEIKRQGGKTVKMNLQHIDVLCLALATGYKLDAKNAQAIKRIIGAEQLPSIARLINALKKKRDHDIQGFITVQKVI